VRERFARLNESVPYFVMFNHGLSGLYSQAEYAKTLNRLLESFPGLLDWVAQALAGGRGLPGRGGGEGMGSEAAREGGRGEGLPDWIACIAQESIESIQTPVDWIAQAGAGGAARGIVGKGDGGVCQ
jgi:hypothetical protein